MQGGYSTGKNVAGEEELRGKPEIPRIGPLKIWLRPGTLPPEMKNTVTIAMTIIKALVLKSTVPG